MTKIKKYNCGNLSLKNVNEIVELNGWVSKIRKMGGLIFIDLRDRYGITQLILNPKNKNYQKSLNIKNEYVLKIIGKVVKRQSINEKISTGKIEIIIDDLIILNKSLQTPLIISDQTDALEDTRLIYRYLDLRRPIMQNKIIIKSKVINIIHNYLEKLNFLNIETPILTKSTPEGARDFIVPSRLNKNKFFALPQSPQLFKQLLMIAGLDKYYQISKCFRDEDLRSDRQPEFLQLDIEMSFIKKEDIFSLIEGLLLKIVKNIKGISLLPNFKKMSFNKAIEDYGTDKPDIRYEFLIQTINSIFKNTKFNIFKKIISENKKIRALYIPYKFSNKNIESLKLIANQNNAKSLSWIFFDEKLNISGSISKFISNEEKNNLIKKFNIKKTGTMFLIADEYFIASRALGAIRIKATKIAQLINKNKLCFLWIIEWPLFEYNKITNEWKSMHHPFTMPIIDSLEKIDSNLNEIKAESYDIVLNGFEIGGGSIRNHDKSVQNKIFKILKLSSDEIQKKFGWFLKAFDYGVPPHGGIALGLDRIIMILTNSNSIRDTIPFPKNSNGVDLMLDAPSKISNDQLKELNIKVK